MGQSNNLTFISVNNIKTYDNNIGDDKEGEDIIATVYIRSDRMYDSYKRKVTDFLTLLGEIGGLYGALFGLGGVVVGFLT